MGFSGRYFNRVLFVCCLVWDSGVGSPWNVGLSSTEASLGQRGQTSENGHGDGEVFRWKE